MAKICSAQVLSTGIKSSTCPDKFEFENESKGPKTPQIDWNFLPGIGLSITKKETPDWDNWNPNSSNLMNSCH